MKKNLSVNELQSYVSSALEIADERAGGKSPRLRKVSLVTQSVISEELTPDSEVRRKSLFKRRKKGNEGSSLVLEFDDADEARDALANLDSALVKSKVIFFTCEISFDLSLGQGGGWRSDLFGNLAAPDLTVVPASSEDFGDLSGFRPLDAPPTIRR